MYFLLENSPWELMTSETLEKNRGLASVLVTTEMRSSLSLGTGVTSMRGLSQPLALRRRPS